MSRLPPPQESTVNKGHGRVENRQIWVSSDLAGYLDFPHCQQVFRIERTVTKLDGTPMRHEVVFGVTSLRAAEGSPRRLLELNRGHWGIENRLHWVRDVTFDEDRSQVRKGAGAQAMAALRNLTIGLLRRAGATNIAAALRHCIQHAEKTLRLIGL
ncbi:MAG: ISAs1 family transposase [Gemmatimonadales bacterium]|nr:MAG: ISAs1 family transposase [Gemmatimonadales bacterium]